MPKNAHVPRYAPLFRRTSRLALEEKSSFPDGNFLATAALLNSYSSGRFPIPFVGLDSYRISKEIEAHGASCGRDKAKTLMKLADVSAKQKRKFKVTTDSKHNLPVAPNLLNREFKVEEPDRVYVSNIT